MARSVPACGMAILALWGPLGCGQTSDTPTSAPGTGQGGGGQGSGGSPPDFNDGGPPDTTCVSPVAPRSPLRRLTNFELDNTIRDLFGDASRPADSLPFDFTNDADAMSLTSSLLAEGYRTLARDLANKNTKDAAAVSAFTGCDPLQIGEEACKQKFINGFIPRAFRHGLDATDAADFVAVFANGQKLGGDFASGVRAVIEVALQSPEFLYRVELGEPPESPNRVRPAPYEMATRLSYLLWGSMPDDALRQAAAQDKLRTNEDIAAQARRLLADDRAHDAVRYFYLQLLHLNDSLWDGHTFDPGRPLPPDLSQLQLEETTRFVDSVTWKGPGDFHSLLTAPFTWMNGPLATFYGVDGVTGDAFQLVSVNPAQRGGLLTQGIFLAATSHATTTSPILRGNWILDQVLCSPIPLPPPNVDIKVALDPPSSGTTRQRVEMDDAAPVCTACHRTMDPIGFAFEHYDPVGLWRDSENGVPIDATGAITLDGAKATFNGAIDLAGRISQSYDAQSCFIGKWMTFAYGRKETPDDACSRQVVQDAFTKSKGNVIELIVALTQTDGFRYRSVKE